MAAEYENGIVTRVAVLEAGHEALREDIRDLKAEDLAEIKHALTQVRREQSLMRNDFLTSRQGMSRAEKMMLGGLGFAGVSAIVAAIALIQGAPG